MLRCCQSFDLFVYKSEWELYVLASRGQHWPLVMCSSFLTHTANALLVIISQQFILCAVSQVFVPVLLRPIQCPHFFVTFRHVVSLKQLVSIYCCLCWHILV